jgi:hypothetical protein
MGPRSLITGSSTWKTRADEHQPSCFALEDEKGEDWKGSGAAKSQIIEARPSL